MPNGEGVRLEEYKALMEEHRTNRRYIFERTIIILGLAAAMVRFSGDSTPPYVLNIVVAGLVIILSFNLKFTLNRLQSDSRVIAYIQIFHEIGFEDYRDKWIGWENALREYRIWEGVLKENGKYDSVITGLLNDDVSKNAIPDRILHYPVIRHYPAIWRLHIALFILIFIIFMEMNCVYYAKERAVNMVELAFEIISIITVVVSIDIFYKSASGSPHNVSPYIERERVIWLAVIRDNIAPKLNRE